MSNQLYITYKLAAYKPKEYISNITRNKRRLITLLCAYCIGICAIKFKSKGSIYPVRIVKFASQRLLDTNQWKSVMLAVGLPVCILHSRLVRNEQLFLLFCFRFCIHDWFEMDLIIIRLKG